MMVSSLTRSAGLTGGRQVPFRIRWHGLVVVSTFVMATLAPGCASTGAIPKPFPTPGSAASPPHTPGTRNAENRRASPVDSYALVGTALSLRGSPYLDGGSDPAGFDCSGFTQYVFAQHGVELPREVRDQYRRGRSVKPSEVRPGDLVFFTTTAPGATHVAIMIGGDEFVHAPSSSGVVRVERISSRYWAPRYVGARRIW